MIFMLVYRFLFGYVSFVINGGFISDFINLCKKENITLTEIKRNKNTLYGNIYLKDLTKLNKICSLCAVDLTYTEKGLPYIIKTHKHRMGLLIGGVIGVFILIFFSLTVWSIDVTGNNKFTTAQIIEICRQHGVKKGVFRSSIDIKQTQNDITNEYDDIIWFSVNIIGSRAFIELRENTEKPEMFTPDTPCNIVSGEDGELIALDIDKGLSAVTIGSGITKGQLLISGVLNNLDGSVNFTHAKGEATVRFNKIIYTTVKDKDKFYTVKEIKKRKSIYFFGITIPLGKKNKYTDKFTYSSFVNSDNISLPVGIKTDIYTTFTKTETAPDSNRILLLAGYEYFKKEISVTEKCETEHKQLKYDIKNGICTVNGTYTLIKDCAIEQYFEVTQEQS